MWQEGIRHYVTVVLVCVSALTAWAQPKDNSPFSRFGIGDPVEQNFLPSSSMGGLSAVWYDFYHANIQNPASYGYLQATALELGFHAKYAMLTTSDISRTIWSGNIDYFSLSIPLINPINELLERRETDLSWGMNLSLVPYSRVGYNIDSYDTVDSIGRVVRNFQGNGGTYRFNFGNGVQYKNLSVGVNLAYLFGRTRYSSAIQFPDLVFDYEHLAESAFSYNGFMWNVGAIYDIPLSVSSRSNARVVSIGGQFSGNKNFTTKGDFLNYVTNSVFLISDTAVYSVNESGEGTLPFEYSFGVMYREEGRLKFGANYEAALWENYENEAKPEDLENSWKVSIGGAYTPDINSITSFFNRVEYRIGAYFQQDPRVIEGEQMRQMGISIGAGLPFFVQRKLTYLNIGLDYGWRGTGDVLKEDFLRFRLGVSLNDNDWFIKRRYN